MRDPLLLMHLFKSFAWVVACMLLGIGRLVFYALAIIWSQMISVLLIDDGGASMRAGWWVSTPGVMMNVGQIVGGILVEPIGKTRYQCMTGRCLPRAMSKIHRVATYFDHSNDNWWSLPRSHRLRHARYTRRRNRPRHRRNLLHRLERIRLPLQRWHRAPRSTRDWNRRGGCWINSQRNILCRQRCLSLDGIRSKTLFVNMSLSHQVCVRLMWSLECGRTYGRRRSCLY